MATHTPGRIQEEFPKNDPVVSSFGGSAFSVLPGVWEGSHLELFRLRTIKVGRFYPQPDSSNLNPTSCSLYLEP